MKNVFSILVIIYVFCIGCVSSENGYSDLDILYSDLVVNLKLEDEKLKDYCSRILLDRKTIEYMIDNNVSIKGIPERIEEQNLDIDAAVAENCDACYRRMLRFKKRLIRSNLLDNLKYLGKVHRGDMVINEALGISASMNDIYLVSNNKNEKYDVRLGSLVRIDENWKTFSNPKIIWRNLEAK